MVKSEYILLNSLAIVILTISITYFLLQGSVLCRKFIKHFYLLNNFHHYNLFILFKTVLWSLLRSVHTLYIYWNSALIICFCSFHLTFSYILCISIALPILKIFFTAMVAFPLFGPFQFAVVQFLLLSNFSSHIV